MESQDGERNEEDAFYYSQEAPPSESIKLSQRPLLTVSVYSLTAQIRLGENLILFVLVQNYGKNEVLEVELELQCPSSSKVTSPKAKLDQLPGGQERIGLVVIKPFFTGSFCLRPIVKYSSSKDHQRYVSSSRIVAFKVIEPKGLETKPYLTK